METQFAHLHLHTEYSLLDGSAKISDIIRTVKAQGMKHVAITDHGAMYGTVEFYKEAKKAGIHPIIGCEIYVAAKDMALKQQDPENTTHHLVLLVKNAKGYDNLMKIVSQASLEGFYYKPRVDHAFLEQHAEGLVCLSACLGGEVQEFFNLGMPEKARAAALFYKNLFGEDYYLELQDHGLQEQKKVNRMNIALAEELDIPLICTNDVHYLKKEDSRAHDILLCIQTGTTVDEEKRMRYPSDEFYLKSPEEMAALFEHVPEALENTVKVAEKCHFDYEFHVSKLPRFPLPPRTDPFAYLEERSYEGMVEKYAEFASYRGQSFSPESLREVADEAQKAIITRLDYELSVIRQMGYVDYFLIVWDFIKFANDHDIATGAGRGSAAGSVVSYCLNITKIDPIRYNLLFERFLNPERISMPDIDSDFCYERRGEVIDYVVGKYGASNVAQIITFGTMAARACIRDVGRAMNYPYGEVDQIAKMIPTMLGITIEKALELNGELRRVYEEDGRVMELIDIAKKLEGLSRHSSTHAAGVVISERPLVEYVPLQKNDESIVTQFTMNTLEELGLLKMDFLGLRTLTVMRDTVDMVRENRGITVDVDALDLKDPQVYKMIGEGKTVGVFQLESAGMTSFMKELKPDSLEDIIAGISLYRPGPMGEIPRYIENKNNPEKVTYLCPQLEPILSVTYGVIIYQEQVMQIVRDLAGYSLGRSDLVRRAMSKKKHDVMEEERRNFIYGLTDDAGNILVPGCLRNGISEAVASTIFDQMMDFASYAFNKAHAAAYAVIGYQTAYLMHYYPQEFMAAMLNSFLGNADKCGVYLRFAKSLGIRILPPDINGSDFKYKVKGDAIIFGLGAIKGVGRNLADALVEVRKSGGRYKNLMDFAERNTGSSLNKRAVEALIKAGAFDGLEGNRAQMLAIYERVLDSFAQKSRKIIDGQVSLFGDILEEEDSFHVEFPRLKEFSHKDLLFMEKEMTGMYLSGHPLDEYEEMLRKAVSHKVSDLLEEEGALLDDIRDDAALFTESVMKKGAFKDGDRVILGGLLRNISRKITRNSAMMAFMNLEDLSGVIECIIFPKTYDKVVGFLKEDSIVLVRGRLSVKEEENVKVIVESLGELKPVKSAKLYLQFPTMNEAKMAVKALRPVLKTFGGETPVLVVSRDKREVMQLSRELWVDEGSPVVGLLREKLGETNVKLVES
ncbi:DNA polymerase III subunit alpha [Proteiniclasticum sp. BAD-10]|uniref:DNA polymerase III subunit alpha n=1 Tax=Proteiniclasticum sediminis TaxID=2804028 RepID=A0A941CT96_9CLOT|nr:DNA polymerase III subunit alpha [Proteiniclasticum sediminis]MBR0577328.1 DNA polymerase III subunit alpha [Proteiniclasticum sediminis]